MYEFMVCNNSFRYLFHQRSSKQQGKYSYDFQNKGKGSWGPFVTAQHALTLDVFYLSVPYSFVHHPRKSQKIQRVRLDQCCLSSVTILAIINIIVFSYCFYVFLLLSSFSCPLDIMVNIHYIHMNPLLHINQKFYEKKSCISPITCWIQAGFLANQRVSDFRGSELLQ